MQAALRAALLGRVQGWNFLARPNLLTSPQALDNAAWSKTNAAIVPDIMGGSGAPLTADKFIPNATTGLHLVNQSFAVTTGANVLVGAVVAPSGLKNMLLRYSNSGETVACQINADVAAGAALSAASAYGGATLPRGGVVRLSSGFCLVWVSGVLPGVGTGRLTLYGHNDANAVSYAGNSVDGLAVWGLFAGLGVEPVT